MLTARPKVAELEFQLYGRALHPELFEIFATEQIDRADYQARLQITRAGHVITWRYAGLTLTEVAASAHHPLPTRRRLFAHRLDGQRSEEVECRGRIRYQTCFQLERLEPELFWAFQQELADDGQFDGLLYKFNSGGRIALGALSYMNVEPRRRQLLVEVYHTFPDDYAVVKTQSLFELP